LKPRITSALRQHHAVDLAQDRMRLVGEFEHVRQHHQVDGLGGEGELVVLGEEIGRLGGGDADAMGDPAFPQQVDAGRPSWIAWNPKMSGVTSSR
jgi:hypothetical protein